MVGVDRLIIGHDAAEILVPPRYVTSFFRDVLGNYDPDAEEIQLMVRVISLIMLDTEGHDLWREAFRRERRGEVLPASMLEQRRRIASYFESWMLARPSMVWAVPLLLRFQRTLVARYTK